MTSIEPDRVRHSLEEIRAVYERLGLANDAARAVFSHGPQPEPAAFAYRLVISGSSDPFSDGDSQGVARGA